MEIALACTKFPEIILEQKIRGYGKKPVTRNGLISSFFSHPEVFFEKGVLTNFTKFTEKHLCQSLFFPKVAGLRLATSDVSMNNPFFIEHLWWLLLNEIHLRSNKEVF